MHNLPNAITVLRILLVLPAGWLLAMDHFFAGLLVMAFAGISDAVDGALARRFRWTSDFGAMADPIADKLLVGVMFVILTVQQHVPLWLAVIVIVRDTVILSGAAIYRWKFERIEMDPSFVSKANTASQIGLVILVLVRLSDLGTASDYARTALDPWCFVIVAVLGVISGVDYVVSWGNRAIRRWRHPA